MQIDILPLGDSITQAESSGNDHYNSYRRPLWQLLQTNGYTSTDLVGSWNVVYPNQTPPDPDYDTDHEGHWGWYAEEIINGCSGCPPNSGGGRLSGWLQGYTPDIVLLHIGTNDLKDSGSDQAVVGQTITEIGVIIDTLRADNPDVTILLAQILPSTRSPRDRRIPLLNAEIPTLALNKSLPNSPIIVVDQFSGISTTTHLYDGTHPNENGEQIMAQRWYDAMVPVLDGILNPTPPVTPTLVPTINGTNFSMDWTPDAATCQYFVYRGATADFQPGTPFALLPFGSNTWTDPTLTPGVTNVAFFYEMEAAGCAGTGTAVSNRVGVFTFAIQPG